MVAAPVVGCEGSYSVAVVDPPVRAPTVQPLDADVHEADQAISAARAVVGTSEELRAARTKSTPPIDPEHQRDTPLGAAWRVGRSVFAVAGVTVLAESGGGCSVYVTVRAVVRRTSAGETTTPITSFSHAGHRPEMFITDLDGDGQAELILRRYDHTTQVWPLGGSDGPVQILNRGGVPDAVGLGC